jgi:hypothetical protein
MKRIVTLIVAFLSCGSLLAQGYRDEHLPPQNHRASHKRVHNGPPPFSYIGFSTGFNNPAGAIGFDFSVPIHRYLAIGAGGGFSTWGNKLYFDAKYFLKPHHRGWALGAGFTFNSGDNNFRTRNMETIAGRKEQVTLDLITQQNVFFAIYHYWNLGHRYNRFFVELGWSIPLNENRFNQLSGDPLTSSSANRIDRLAPGGLMAGLGFSFGLHH